MTKREQTYLKRIHEQEREIQKLEDLLDGCRRTILEYQLLHISQGLPFSPPDEGTATGIYYSKRGILQN